MIYHPLSLTIIIFDAAGLIFLTRAGVQCLKLLLESDHSSRQNVSILHIQNYLPTLSLPGRIAFFLQVCSLLILIPAITQVFPGHINGALCGTGVIEAMGSGATHMLFIKTIALLFLYGWVLLDTFHRKDSSIQSLTGSAKALLLTLPITYLAVFFQIQSLYLIDKTEEVNCCIIYNQVISLSGSSGVQKTFYLWSVCLLIFSSLLAFLAGRSILKNEKNMKYGWTVLIVTLAWCGLAFLAVQPILAYHHFGEIDHHCLWCLFLKNNNFIGFPLYFALFLAAFSGVSIFIATLFFKRLSQNTVPSANIYTIPSATLLAALVLYLLVSYIPGLL